MGKINLTASGGEGPFTITIREVNELSGNRYTGPNPTNTLSNLDVNFIKDNTDHLYSVNVSNQVCSLATEIFQQKCECENIPSFVASQDCTNPQNPKISVTANSGIPGGIVRIRIYNALNNLLHDVIGYEGTWNLPVTNNATYRVAVSTGYEGLENCKAVDQFITVSCTIECSLSITISNPTC